MFWLFLSVVTFFSVVLNRLNLISWTLRNPKNDDSVAYIFSLQNSQGKTMVETGVKLQLKQEIPVWFCTNVGHICLVDSDLSSSLIKSFLSFFRSAACMAIAVEHRKWLLRGHNSVYITDAQQVVIYHRSSCHLSAVRQPASFNIFLTTAPKATES